MHRVTGKSYIERLVIGSKLNGDLIWRLERAILDSKHLDSVASAIQSLRPFDVVNCSKTVSGSSPNNSTPTPKLIRFPSFQRS